jgi:hypothetical protein
MVDHPVVLKLAAVLLAMVRTAGEGLCSHTSTNRARFFLLIRGSGAIMRALEH